MYKLSCKAMGSMDCDFEATGNSVEEVLQKGKEHATQAHPDKLKEMMSQMSEEQMMEMMKKAVTEVK